MPIFGEPITNYLQNGFYGGLIWCVGLGGKGVAHAINRPSSRKRFCIVASLKVVLFVKPPIAGEVPLPLESDLRLRFSRSGMTSKRVLGMVISKY